MTVNTPTNVNLFDPETQRCPYDAYKTLRDEAPVYQCPATGMYVITRFDDVRQILTDTEHFTNETAYLTDATEPSPRALAVRNTFQEEGWVPAKTLNGRDDPDHKAVRSVFNDAFRPKKIEAMFASRACRKSIMVGRALERSEQIRVVRHLATMDQPWNCPHGRPTLQHMFVLR